MVKFKKWGHWLKLAIGIIENLFKPKKKYEGSTKSIRSNSPIFCASIKLILNFPCCQLRYADLSINNGTST